MRTILLIEDDLDTADAMQLLLQTLGYGVVLATNEPDACQLVAAASCDLVILDAGVIHNRHGFVALIERTGVPVIVYSAAAYKAQEFTKIVRYWLRKPSDMERLLELVPVVCESKHV